MLEWNAKSQHYLIIPNFKRDGAEEPTINNFYKMEVGQFEYPLKVRIDRNRPHNHISTEIDSNTTWLQVS